jgi:hypothetical protein
MECVSGNAAWQTAATQGCLEYAAGGVTMHSSIRAALQESSAAACRQAAAATVVQVRALPLLYLFIGGSKLASSKAGAPGCHMKGLLCAVGSTTQLDRTGRIP